MAAAQDRYDLMTRTMLERYQIRVRRWRTAMTGVAWYVTYSDGRVSRLIEAPRPKGPMSAAIFLHEVGHHAIGFDVYKPRCREEYYAWAWAIAAIQEWGLNITQGVQHRMRLSLWYALDKARRRGLQQVPEELAPYTERPVRPRSAQPSRVQQGSLAPARPSAGTPISAKPIPVKPIQVRPAPARPVAEPSQLMPAAPQRAAQPQVAAAHVSTGTLDRRPAALAWLTLWDLDMLDRGITLPPAG